MKNIISILLFFVCVCAFAGAVPAQEQAKVYSIQPDHYVKIDHFEKGTRNADGSPQKKGVTLLNLKTGKEIYTERNIERIVRVFPNKLMLVASTIDNRQPVFLLLDDKLKKIEFADGFSPLTHFQNNIILVKGKSGPYAILPMSLNHDSMRVFDECFALNDHIIKVKEKGKYALFNSRLEQTTGFEFDGFGVAENNYVAFNKNGVYGLLDYTTGKTLLNSLSECPSVLGNLAFMHQKDGQLVFYDLKTERVHRRYFDIEGFRIPVGTTSNLIVYKGGKLGLMDARAKVIQPFVFDAMKFKRSRDNYLLLDGKFFINGVEIRGVPGVEYIIDDYTYISKRDSKYGIVNRGNKVLVEHVYDEIMFDPAERLISFKRGDHYGYFTANYKKAKLPAITSQTGFINGYNIARTATGSMIILDSSLRIVRNVTDSTAFHNAANETEDLDRYLFSQSGNPSDKKN